MGLFFGPFSLALSPDSFLSWALPVPPSWGASAGRPVAPSSAASRPPLSLLGFFASPAGLISLFYLVGGPFVSRPPFLFRVWPRRRAFASTRPLILPSTSSGGTLLACPPFPPWNLPSFAVESVLSSPCSRLFLLSLAEVRLLPALALSPLVVWCSGRMALFLFLLAGAAPAFLPCALSLWH